MQRQPSVAAAVLAAFAALVAAATAMPATGHAPATRQKCRTGPRIAGHCRTLIALDRYSRTLGAGELGVSDRGGAWTVYRTRTISVDGRAVQAAVAPANTNRDYLNTVRCGDCDVEIDVSWNRIPTGSGAHFYVCARTSSAGTPAGYGVLVDARAAPYGMVQLQLVKYDAAGRRTLLGPPALVTSAYLPGHVYRVRLRLFGSKLYAAIWSKGTRAPIRWQVQARDRTFRRGGIGIRIVNTVQARDAPHFTIDNLAAYRLSA